MTSTEKITRIEKVVVVAVGLLMGFCFMNHAHAASTNSNKVDVALSANILTGLTVVVANPAVVWGVVTPGASNPAPLGQAVAVVSTWSLAAGQTVKMYAYFDSASSAMSGTLTGSLIPASAFTGSVNGGASATFSQTNPFGGSSALQMYSQTLTSLTAISTRTDTLALTMDLTGQTQLAADNYTGVMHLQAQAL